MLHFLSAILICLYILLKNIFILDNNIHHFHTPNDTATVTKRLKADFCSSLILKFLMRHFGVTYNDQMLSFIKERCVH
jgi:hypothetical protein